MAQIIFLAGGSWPLFISLYQSILRLVRIGENGHEVGFTHRRMGGTQLGLRTVLLGIDRLTIEFITY